jgi:LEA14-like dessication related protein
MATALALPGCSLFRPAWDADVALIDLRITDVTMLQARTVFTVRIDNAEPEPLILDGSVHEITLDGRRVGRGMQPERIEIPRLSSAVIEVPIDISTVALIDPVRRAVENERFDYEVRSTLYVMRGASRHRVSVTKRGRADFADLR